MVLLLGQEKEILYIMACRRYLFEMRFSGVLLRRLRRTFQNNRRGMLSSGIVLIQNNVLLHTAAFTLTDSFTISMGSV